MDRLEWPAEHERLDFPRRGPDKRPYFLGESDLLAAKACRLLSRRDEMRRWLNRAEAGFRRSAVHVEDLSRVAYERLALWVEERRFDEVLELLPDLFETMVGRARDNTEIGGIVNLS